MEIQRMAENWLQRIINKLHTHVTDFRTNPAVFLGGGSLLLRSKLKIPQSLNMWNLLMMCVLMLSDMKN